MKKITLFSLLLLFSITAYCDYLVTSRKTSVKEDPTSSSQPLLQVEAETSLELLDDGAQTNGYYHVRSSLFHGDGWIYRTFVRRYRGTIGSSPRPVSNDGPETPVPADDTLEESYLPSISHTDVIVSHDGFISCMSREWNVPRWVYHKISASLLEGRYSTRPNGYKSDPLYGPLKTSAYEKSGYDHGHLAPAADFKRSAKLYKESFYMTNMSPQHGCFNQKGWCLLESNVRKWAEDRAGSEFYIFSGSIMDGAEDILCLGNVAVYVPASFFKIVAERRNGRFIRGVAFVIDNSDVDGNEVDSYRTSIDDVERITGYNFFPQLTAGEESSVETSVGNYVLEDLPDCPKRNSDCEGVYGRRNYPEDRDELWCEE